MGKNIRAILFGAAVCGPMAAQADDRPLALIEHINAAPEAGFQIFDYVYEGDKIDLRPGGEIRIAYFDNCLVETISGGLVKLKNDGAKTTKGGVSTQETRPCQTAALLVDEKAREAGVSVKRVTPFPEQEWREFSVATSTPRFIWTREKKQGEATVTVVFLDTEPTQTVWQGVTTDHHLNYPIDAPTLQPGMPYEAVVTYDGKRHASGVFSIDPALELPESPLTTSIPLGL